MHKNKIFVNKIKNKIGHNQSFSEVVENNDIIIKKEEPIKKNISIEDKLHSLFNRNGYIFNVDVDIITNNKEYHTKIASKVGNNIITLDNDIINIHDIKDLIIKN